MWWTYTLYLPPDTLEVTSVPLLLHQVNVVVVVVDDVAF